MQFWLDSMSIICVHSNFETPDLLKEKKGNDLSETSNFHVIDSRNDFCFNYWSMFIGLKIGKKDTDR